MEALQRQLNQMNAPQHQMFNCEFCGGNHNSMDFQVSASFEQVNFLGNFQMGQITIKGQFIINFQIEAKIDF